MCLFKASTYIMLEFHNVIENIEMTLKKATHIDGKLIETNTHTQTQDKQ